jgi:hypothetical protein
MMLAWSFAARTPDEVARLLRALGKHRYVHEVDHRIHWAVDQALAEKISAKTGIAPVSALRLVTARHRGVLLPYLELEFDDLGTVSVADVLADPDRYVGETLADPLEGVSYGRCKAKVMRADDGSLLIHSHGRGILPAATYDQPRRQ